MSILQNQLLEPVLGIAIRARISAWTLSEASGGWGNVERRCHEDMKVAFSMYPTSISELLSVADAGLLMLPSRPGLSRS